MPKESSTRIQNRRKSCTRILLTGLFSFIIALPTSAEVIMNVDFDSNTATFSGENGNVLLNNGGQVRWTFSNGAAFSNFSQLNVLENSAEFQDAVTTSFADGTSNIAVTTSPGDTFRSIGVAFTFAQANATGTIRGRSQTINYGSMPGPILAAFESYLQNNASIPAAPGFGELSPLTISAVPEPSGFACLALIGLLSVDLNWLKQRQKLVG